MLKHLGPNTVLSVCAGVVWASLAAHAVVAHAEEPRDGSLSLIVSQRFFDDQKLSRVNGFSHWGAIQFDVVVGITELPYRFEPVVGASYIQNTSLLCGLDDTNSCVYENGQLQVSQDRLRYQIFGGHVGIRHRFWEREYFVLVPWVQMAAVYRYGRVRKLTLNQEQKLNVGGDLGGELAGGVLVSFFGDEALASDMSISWEAQDFALLAQIRYSPAGWWRQGLGLVSSIGGWDFGLGIFLDW